MLDDHSESDVLGLWRREEYMIPGMFMYIVSYLCLVIMANWLNAFSA